MTPEEVADIVLSLVDVDKKLLKPGVFEAVVLEIRAAVEEEAAKWKQREKEGEVWNQNRIRYWMEDAAKIAEDTQTTGDPFDLPKVVATRIRARAKDLK